MMKTALLILAGSLMSLSAADILKDAQIITYDPVFEELIDKDAQLEILAEGFGWSEGPVWDKKGNRLLFTDVPGNRLHAWDQKNGLSTFLEPSGFSGVSEHGKRQGANGLFFDQKGRLMMCEHGDRRISVLTEHGGKMTVVDNWEGKRFNSPNDLVQATDGSIYFTDPPYGLQGREKSEDYQTGMNGIYRVTADGKVTAEVIDLERPNGICLSLDEKTVYVGHAMREKPYILAYPRKADGSLGEGKVLFDCSEIIENGPGSCDGLRVDEKGNIWATAPGGVVVISPEGKKLGAIVPGGSVANLAWGEDGKSLFLTAHKRLLKVRTLVNAGRL